MENVVMVKLMVKQQNNEQFVVAQEHLSREEWRLVKKLRYQKQAEREERLMQAIRA